MARRQGADEQVVGLHDGRARQEAARRLHDGGAQLGRKDGAAGEGRVGGGRGEAAAGEGEEGVPGGGERLGSAGLLHATWLDQPTAWVSWVGCAPTDADESPQRSGGRDG